MTEKKTMMARLRIAGRSAAIGAVCEGLTTFGRLSPASRPETHGLEVIKDVPYQAGDAVHRLDVWRPRRMLRRRPAVLYIHGGGFHMLSKDSHWLFALGFARRGCVVFCIDYRMAPKDPFPAAARDACAAAIWVHRNAAAYGGDPNRLILAGESAGANLVSTVAIAACFDRPEPWARAVTEAGVRPAAVLPACGILECTGPERFATQPDLAGWMKDYCSDVCSRYLGGDTVPSRANELADPLRVLESDYETHTPLPPFFALVGTRDPLLGDTLRLAAALQRRGGIVEARYYSGGIHAFHALVWQDAARRAWRDQFDFLERRLGTSMSVIPVGRQGRHRPQWLSR